MSNQSGFIGYQAAPGVESLVIVRGTTKTTLRTWRRQDDRVQFRYDGRRLLALWKPPTGPLTVQPIGGGKERIVSKGNIGAINWLSPGRLRFAVIEVVDFDRLRLQLFEASGPRFIARRIGSARTWGDATRILGGMTLEVARKALPTDLPRLRAETLMLPLVEPVRWIQLFPEIRRTAYMSGNDIADFDWDSQKTVRFALPDHLVYRFPYAADARTLSVTQVANAKPARGHGYPSPELSDVFEPNPSETYSTLLLDVKTGKRTTVPNLIYGVRL